MADFKLLAIGDVVGPQAVDYLCERLWNFRRENGIHMVICNAENASTGNGLDPKSADRLLAGGADVLTSGNHIFRQRAIRSYLDDSETVIRPANYPAGTPGNGYTIVNIDGFRVLVINLLGTIYMESLECPFTMLDRILNREDSRYDFAVVDFHGEATSEKIALGRHFDGRVSALFGTHTHVPTADVQILPRGCGYVTDLGMTGPIDSVLGVRTELIIEKLRTKMPVKFEIADGSIRSDAVCFTLDDRFICKRAERVSL